ncbi:hypothetical protein QUF75_05625 [Desulfococcaceae bacterium HSG7]|nr:hypothetical protein [Desulfococcaceae bacterium HSG9]MDM8554192.1 hypothetical protein [Desulfococcaceae bacterium HSG7]
MGVKLGKIYDIVTNKKGYGGRMQFAQKIGVSKNKALKIKDTDEIVRKFKAVAADFIGENIDKFL